MKPTLKQHFDNARYEYERRQEFLADKKNVIHWGMPTKTLCGLSVYQWEEFDWPFMPLADDKSEITRRVCKAAYPAYIKTQR